MEKNNENFINFKFNNDVAKSLIGRFGGYSFFSEEAEKEANEYMTEKEYSMAEIIGILIIFGVKNFDAFDMNALFNAASCKISELELIFNKPEVKKLLPLKLSKKMVEDKKNELNKELKINDFEAEKKRIDEILKKSGKQVTIETLIKARQKEDQRIIEALNRFEEWKNKRRIILID